MITTRLESSATAVLNAVQSVVTQNRQRRNTWAVRSMEITLEPHRVCLMGQRRRSSLQWCARCGSGFRMVTAFAAASMADISFRTLYRWAETEEIHFSVTTTGALIVCLDSLLERTNAQEARLLVTELTTA
jgi:hypothetical protein